MSGLFTLFEHDRLVAEGGKGGTEGAHVVPRSAFDWLSRMAERCSNEESASWVQVMAHRGGQALKVRNHVGVVRSPCGCRFEILPKIGRVATQPADIARLRTLLVNMIRCLFDMKHVELSHLAGLRTAHMTMFDVFIRQFLATVQQVVRRGLRSDYVTREDNLQVLRGKLQIAGDIRHNLVRRDRFFVAFDEYLPDRAENRLLRSALRLALQFAEGWDTQRLARELLFAFDEVPESRSVADDLQRIRLDRGMESYAPALAWARLLLNGLSPVPAAGTTEAPPLLFPMEQLFEAYVARHLRKQLAGGLHLVTRPKARHLVSHRGQKWFKLIPDLAVNNGTKDVAILDTKWKVLDQTKGNSTNKYGIAQSDIYQLYTYGRHFLQGCGPVVLIYPKTEQFDATLDPFYFRDCPKEGDFTLWVVPFCLDTKKLLVRNELRDLFPEVAAQAA